MICLGSKHALDLKQMKINNSKRIIAVVFLLFHTV